MLTRDAFKRGLVVLIGLLGIGGVAGISAPPAAAECRELEVSGWVRVICSEPGQAIAATTPDGGGVARPEPDVAPPECRMGATVVPCSTDAGAWNGSCYVKATVPQPPFDDPRWSGRTDGVILDCTGVAVDSSFGLGIALTTSFWAPAPPAGAVDPELLARQALASLSLPGAPISMTPEPNLIEPNVLIRRDNHVWVPQGSLVPMTASASDGGLTVSLTASPSSIIFTSKDGDGVTSASCDPALIDGPPSNPLGTPVCSLVWERTSRDQPDGQYTITASTTWTAAWTGGGQSGTLTTTTTSTAQVAVTDWPVRLVPNPS